MFNKILIANRGEIACRIIHTAKKLGIKTVAVYSDADANAVHVTSADEAVHIGSSAASDSYLDIGKIIKAAKTSNAQAIHPGYGFLSENPNFVDAVKASELKFIGPSADAIRAMGLKDAAKKLMEKSGVPVVPGYHGKNQDPEFLHQQAEEIGYPVLIKARAGGGGKGMRLVETADNFSSALESAVREATASFSDGHVLIEKFVAAPRHIEIQIFGDNHGNVVHLFERDCSLQRRHQKVIEEAPAPGMTTQMRNAMGDAAVKAAKAVNYSGAGTVEFIVDGSDGLSPDKFWFMEMNTRLQVEHPVTEAITGLDLVELQLLVADGQPLPFVQSDLAINGWAFEARLYAEDVPKGFLPATGTLDHAKFPAATHFEVNSSRIDSGIQQGNEISPFYDPMIAKVITHAKTRQSALAQLTRMLASCHISGCITNLDFLHALSLQDSFVKGDVDTGLIERHATSLTPTPQCPPQITALAALISLDLWQTKENGHASNDPWGKYQGWRQWENASYFQSIEHNGAQLKCVVEDLGSSDYTVNFGETSVFLNVKAEDSNTLSLSFNGLTSRAQFVRINNKVSIFYLGQTFHFTPVNAAIDENLADDGGDQITAPMPGSIIKITANTNSRVTKGDGLLVLEAMKMEHVLTAPRDGIIAEILTQTGDQVQDGAILLTLKSEKSS